MKTKSLIKIFASSIVFVAACGQADPGPLGSWLGAALTENAEFENSDRANAYARNAYARNAYARNPESTNLASYQGVSYAGVKLGSDFIDNVTVVDGKLTGKRRSDNAQLTGSALKNARLKGRYTDSSEVDIRIDDVVYDSTYDLNWNYASVSFDSGATWEPYCKNGEAVLPVTSRWSATSTRISDSTLFTLACDMAALAKCVKWGYNPQRSKQECDGAGHCKQQPLDDWHEACTRLVTADYCGDGVPHTRTGTPIDIYDNLDIQTRSGTLRGVEADWSANGARCIRQTRWVNATGLGNDLDYITAHCPERLAINNPVSCGGDPYKGNADVTNFPSSAGYSVDTSVRNLLRVDSYGFLP